ncbi:MAG: hypothetical protein DI537_05100 [Stutzerimonas stutzeri]|nr:MAG: hypothetical protein DI537_05100 [Stutzerimonas stutzeri]
MTLDVVQRLLHGNRETWMRTFDNIASAIAGQPKSQLGRAGVNAIWNQIAFYNYVPVVAAHTPGVSPSEQHFAMGAQPFDRLIETLEPLAIIVCGYRLWPRFISNHAVGYTDNLWKPSTPFAAIGTSAIPALRMAHPSIGYSPPAWTALIADLLTKGSASSASKT